MGFSFSKEFSKNSYITIENAFIRDYLPLSSGEAVKVYLYGLYACNHSQEKSLKDIAGELDLTEQMIIDCFKYWEEFGLLSIIFREPLSVIYFPINSHGIIKPRKYKPEKYTEFSKGLQLLLPNRMISTNEFTEYFNVMETYSIKPEALLLIVKYCIEKKGDGISYRYIIKVAKDFGNRELNTVEKVEKELSSYSVSSSVIEKIFKSIKITRQPDIEDQNLLKKWINELNFDEENILFAAKKLKRASMQKLDEFLMELYSIKSFSKEEISVYVDNKQKVYDIAIKINKALAIYVEILDTVIETYTKKWLSYGYEEATLLLIASECFKKGKNSLRDMDELIEQLRNRGFIDLSSVGDYFELEKKTDKFIKTMLTTCGINRRPTPWDTDNVNMWRSWNFSDDIILEAAKRASGKSSPIAYMNGVLSNWKNNNAFDYQKILSLTDSPQQFSTIDYNKEYERRRTLAISKAQKNTEKAMEITGFSNDYERLFAIEKDLAFAEMASDENKLKELEQEKEQLTKTLSKLLKESLSLDLSDLSPKYACEKCNDTGYVGTHRCDCFDKIV